jgi:hypothetical protein
MPAQPQGVHPQKHICEYKKIANLGEITYLLKIKFKKEFDKLIFGNGEFVKWNFNVFTLPRS